MPRRQIVIANLYTHGITYVAIAAAVVLLRLLFSRNVPLSARGLALFAANAALLGCLSGFRKFGPLLAGYVAVIVVLGEWIRRAPAGSERRRMAFTCGAVLVVGALCAYKSGPLRKATGIGASFVGLSYLTLRAYDYLIQCRSGRAKIYGPIPLLCYLTFFATYLAGPINRYQQFAEDLAKRDEPLSFERFRRDVTRIAIGVVKMLFLGRLALHNSILDEGFAAASPGIGILAMGLAAHLLYIYFDFSGYCDAAIGVADLLGFRVPENFNWPFTAGNIQEFWNQWHISLSHFCRDHIFFPILTELSRRYKRLPGLVSACLSVFVTFTLLGAWHGDTIHWVLYGCYHGAGLSAHQVYRAGMDRFFPDAFDALHESRLYGVACVLLTLSFVTLGFLLSIPFGAAGGLIRRHVLGIP